MQLLGRVILVVAAALALPLACARPSARRMAAAPAHAPTGCPNSTTAVARGEPPRQVLSTGHHGEVQGVAFSPNGRWLASAGRDGTKIWDVARKQAVRVFDPLKNHGAWTVAWEDDAHAVAVEEFGQARRLDVAGGTTDGVFPGDAHAIVRIDAPDARWIGTGFTAPSGAQRAALHVFDADRKLVLEVPAEEGADNLWSLAASRDGSEILATAFGGARIERFRRARGERTWRAIGVTPTKQTKVGAVAVSPDGAHAAVAWRGTHQNGVSIMKLGDAMEHQCLLPGSKASGLPQPLAFSADGARVAAAMEGGVAVWDATACALRWKQEDLAGTSLAFSPDGATLVVGDDDGALQLFDAANGRARGQIGWKTFPLNDAVFVDGGATLMTGNGAYDRGWSISTARALPRVDPPGPPIQQSLGRTPHDQPMIASRVARGTGCEGGDMTRFATLASASDGRTSPAPPSSAWPPAPGTHRDVCLPDGVWIEAWNGDSPLAIATVKDKGLAVVDLASAPPRVTPLPEGERCTTMHVIRGALVAASCYAASDFPLRVWDAASARLLRELRVTPFDPRAPSSVGTVRASAALDPAISPDGKLVAADAERHDDDRSDVEIWEVASGQRVAHVDVPGSVHVMTFSDPRTLVIGTKAGRLFVVRDGRVLDEAAPVGGSIFELAAREDGRLLAAQTADGAVRLWDLGEKLSLRATLVEFENDEWIVATPAGAYTGTREVGERLGWVFSAPLEPFGFEQFAAAYQDPALVKRRLSGEAVDARAVPVRPPRIAIAGEPPRRVRGEAAAVRVATSSGSTVERVRAFVEGRPLAEREVCAQNADALELEVPLPFSTDRVSLVAFDDHGFASNPLVLDVARELPVRRPDAWVVSVGVGRYPHLPAEMQLDAAVPDARGVAEAFARARGASFGEVHATTLLDEAATPAAIVARLGELAAMDPDDVAIVFFAGHGFKPADGADMVFVTSGTEMRADGRGPTDDSLRASAVRWSDLATALSRARGRVLVLIDACHSGHVSQELVVPNDALADALVREHRAGVVVFSAAKGRQVSYEPATTRGWVLSPGERRKVSYEGGHGFFTGALLDAIADPSTDRDGDGALELSEIVDDVTRRVKSVSGGKQTPWIARRDMFGDFRVLAAARRDGSGN